VSNSLSEVIGVINTLPGSLSKPAALDEPCGLLVLDEYPTLIAEAERYVAECIKDLRAAQMVLDNIEARIKYAVAFDSDLKNEGQRKAQELSLMSGDSASTAVQVVHDAKHTLYLAEIERDLLKNQFKVALLLTQP
jgi:hypothetical protein